jgi:hypothetical protein
MQQSRNDKVRARLDKRPLMDDPVELRKRVESLIDDLRTESDTAVENHRTVLF